MKVKLLKKVREKFSITYYPKGISFTNISYSEPLIYVYDKVGRQEIAKIFLKEFDYITKQTVKISLDSAKIQAHRELVWFIRRKFVKYGTRRIKAEKLRKANEEIQWKLKRNKEKLEQELAKETLWYNKKQ